MSAGKKLAAGFDPGGKSKGNKFGWCVASLRPWRVIGKGAASCADDAFCRASRIVGENCGNLVAAGVDAPLVWARDGGMREADKHVQEWGTAQAVNSIWGACLAQGFLLAKILETKHPECLITETNPKPLLEWLKRHSEVPDGVVERGDSEDVRDAVISAWAAAQVVGGHKGVNLYDRESESKIYRVSPRAVYWWPENPP